MQAPRMTEAELQDHLKRAGRGWVVDEEQPAPDLPVPLDVGHRYRSQWELQYADFLEQQRHLREIEAWLFEPFNIRLAGNTYYTPDFLVVAKREFQIHEVKGRRRQKGLVKFKVARELLPWFRWIMVTKIKGIWEEVAI